MTEAISDDPFDLDRFLQAQEAIYETALAEIRNGNKQSHWMWFIFPQMAGLGSSPMAQRYGLESLDEGRAYLAHPVLGERYRECVGALQALADRNAEAIFGPVDAMKLRSSLTLFGQASDEPLFEEALMQWFAQSDPETMRRLGRRYG